MMVSWELSRDEAEDLVELLEDQEDIPDNWRFRYLAIELRELLGMNPLEKDDG